MNRALLILPLLALAACGGGNLCDKTAKYAEDCGTTVSDEDLETCEEQLSHCSKSDENLLEDMYDCFADNGFFECDGSSSSSSSTSSTGFGDLFALLACMDGMEDLSTECAQYFGMGFSSSSSSSTWSSTTSSR